MIEDRLGKQICGSSVKRSSPATVSFSPFISRCFLNHLSGSTSGTMVSEKNLYIPDSVASDTSDSPTGSFSKEEIPLSNSKRQSFSGVSTGRLWAPLLT